MNATHYTVTVPNVRFALDTTKRLFFAGMWTRWHGVRKKAKEEADHKPSAFLTSMMIL